VPLIESLALPPDIAAAANPKSSTGRLDVFTRVIADETRGFDRVAAGYHGPLYAEISPKTFPVLVREGIAAVAGALARGDAIAQRRSACAPACKRSGWSIAPKR
jgi:dCTP deaminase